MEPRKAGRPSADGALSLGGGRGAWGGGHSGSGCGTTLRAAGGFTSGLLISVSLNPEGAGSVTGVLEPRARPGRGVQGCVSLSVSRQHPAWPALHEALPRPDGSSLRSRVSAPGSARPCMHSTQRGPTPGAQTREGWVRVSGGQPLAPSRPGLRLAELGRTAPGAHPRPRPPRSVRGAERRRAGGVRRPPGVKQGRTSGGRAHGGGRAFPEQGEKRRPGARRGR